MKWELEVRKKKKTEKLLKKLPKSERPPLGDLATAEHGASRGTSSLAASGSSFGEPRFVREIDPERTPATEMDFGLRLAINDSDLEPYVFMEQLLAYYGT